MKVICISLTLLFHLSAVAGVFSKTENLTQLVIKYDKIVIQTCKSTLAKTSYFDTKPSYNCSFVDLPEDVKVHSQHGNLLDYDVLDVYEETPSYKNDYYRGKNICTIVISHSDTQKNNIGLSILAGQNIKKFNEEDAYNCLNKSLQFVDSGWMYIYY